MKAKELLIPPDALTDPEAFEILRAWAAHGELHVTIESALCGEAKDFGELLADLFEHAARLYSQRDKRPIEQCRLAILGDFRRRIRDNPKKSEGEIPTEH